MQYVKRSTLNGVPEPDEIVDQAHLTRFTSEATVDFFRGLGGTEKVTTKDGVTTVESVSPDGRDRRITTFTPKDA